ncbi:MAG: multi-sensor signal transduction histidine kinase [Rhodocyclaceae bacterium]|nr:MAG: multi-sensor signal transduction histidine kinase [Rhodocyclaceae bacterium]TND00422.1 MAG: multi-sensor signal transduction histidine kinase [Rhodocyclaceae bacterium]
MNGRDGKQQRDPQLRAKAEARLTAKLTQRAAATQRPVEELLHELQVHQIELEMQNETLRQSQIALEESRDRYIDFYDFAPVGYLTLSDKGQIAEINLTGAEMLGMDRARLLKRRFSLSVMAGDRDRWQQHFTSALGKNAKLNSEVMLSRPDRSRIDVRLDSLRLIKEGKAPVLRLVLTDVTERKQVQGALDASVQFSNSLVGFMQDGLSVVDTDGVHLDVNPALCRMTGFSREELIGSGLPHPYWPPEEHEAIQAAFRNVRAGHTNALELTFMRKGGERFPVIVSPSVVKDVQGRVVGYMATMKDITERRKAEDALKASQQRFRDIVNTTDGIVWEADAKTFTFTFVSQQAERLLGYPARDWLQPGFWADHLHPDDKTWAPGYCEACTRKIMPHDFEYRFIARDGRTVWLHDMVTVVVEDGEPRWLRGIMVDVTRGKEAEQQLREMAASLEANVQERTTQLRRLSAQLTMTEERERRMLAEDLHDNLGQLLAVIKIKLTTLAAGSLTSSVDEVVALVDQAERSARSITMELSPPILHRLGLMPALEWLGDEIERVYGIAVRIHGDLCDRPLGQEIQAVLYRSVRELLINVAKHAGVNDASVSCLCSESQLVLVVDDDGCGFDPADHHGAMSGQRSFGLSSIYERMVNLGGAMEVDSSPGNGTTITLTVPCLTAQ